MTDAIISTDKREDKLFIHLLLSVLITAGLFFIDEGAYNFDWTTNAGNWFVFVVYSIGLLFGQFLSQRIIFSKYHGKYKTMLISLAGIPIGLMLLFALFYSLMS